jgi:4-coumarate--CoA ligase
LARRTAGGRQVNFFIFHVSRSLTVIFVVAAGLRCTLANSAYNARELAHQYIDSGARLILTSEEGLSVTRETLRSLGLTDDQVDRKIVVLGSSLDWAGGPAAPRIAEAAGLLHMDDLLKLGTLAEEEKFDGRLAHETVYLCYSSGGFMQMTSYS